MLRGLSGALDVSRDVAGKRCCNGSEQVPAFGFHRLMNLVVDRDATHHPEFESVATHIFQSNLVRAKAI